LTTGRNRFAYKITTSAFAYAQQDIDPNRYEGDQEHNGKAFQEGMKKRAELDI